VEFRAIESSSLAIGSRAAPFDIRTVARPNAYGLSPPPVSKATWNLASRRRLSQIAYLPFSAVRSVEPLSNRIISLRAQVREIVAREIVHVPSGCVQATPRYAEVNLHC